MFFCKKNNHVQEPSTDRNWFTRSLRYIRCLFTTERHESDNKNAPSGSPKKGSKIEILQKKGKEEFRKKAEIFTIINRTKGRKSKPSKITLIQIKPIDLKSWASKKEIMKRETIAKTKERHCKISNLQPVTNDTTVENNNGPAPNFHHFKKPGYEKSAKHQQTDFESKLAFFESFQIEEKKAKNQRIKRKEEPNPHLIEFLNTNLNDQRVILESMRHPSDVYLYNWVRIGRGGLNEFHDQRRI